MGHRQDCFYSTQRKAVSAKHRVLQDNTARGETILTLCYELPLQAFLFLASVDIMEFHTFATHCCLCLTAVTYSINKLSRVRN